MNSVDTKCKWAGICSGCKWITKDLSVQRKDKLDSLLEVLSDLGFVLDPKNVGFLPLRDLKIRDRADISFFREKDQSFRVGLYELSSRRLVDIDHCAQMTEELSGLYQFFRENLPPIEFGTVRLRVSPQGEWGMWFDIPNLSTKYLLEEKTYLKFLLKHTRVEIGQKRKSLEVVDGELKLTDSIFSPWFQTYVGEALTPSPLYMQVGGFSQAGFDANKALISGIRDFVQDLPIQKAAELCSGSGNIGIAIASWGIKLEAIELDRSAVEAAKLSASKAGLNDNLKFRALNVHKKSKELESVIAGVELLLVDPPRSGLGASLDVLQDLEREMLPKYFLYISCFLPSLKGDLDKLRAMGYSLNRASLLDQFSHSPHCEYIVLLSLS